MVDILHAIQITASAESVFPLVSTAAGLARWRAADVTETEGAVDLGFFNRKTSYRLRLQDLGESRRTEWLCETGEEWTGTRLIFALEPRGAGTVVRFSHAGWKAQTDYFVFCTTTWGELMFRLAAEAEGKRRGPLFTPDGMAY